MSSGPGAFVWALRLLVIVAAVFWSSYVAAANLFLWTGARHLFSPVSLDFERAYTLWPGDFRFRALSLRGEGGGRPWSMWLSRASMHIELGELWSRRVHVTHFEGDGLVFESGKVTLAADRVLGAGAIEEAAPRAGSVLDLPAFVLTAKRGESPLRLEGRLHAEAEEEGGLVTLSDTALHRADGRRAVDLSARLKIRGGTISLEEGVRLRGSIDVEGGDGGVLFDLVGASETLRWMFSLIQGEPFRLHAQVERRPGEIDLRDVEATSGALTAQGALRYGAETEGALLLRAGRLSAGVFLSEGETKVIAAPEEGWLEERSR